MKKTLAILLALTMLLALAACGGTSGTTKAAEGTASAPEPAATETPATPEPTAEPTPEPTPEPTEEPAADGPAGAYKMTGYETEDTEGAEAMDSMLAMGITYYIVLNEDGTGNMVVFGMEIPLTWDENAVNILENEETGTEATEIPYTCDGGVLKLINEGEAMVFTKMTDEEYADFLANGSGSLEDLLGGLYTEPEPIPEGEPSAGPVSGTVGGMDVTILGAEHTKENGAVAIRFYYTVTNNTGKINATWNLLNADAAQDGDTLESAWFWEGVPEDNYTGTRIAPGCSIVCAQLFSYDHTGGVVGFRLSSYEDENTLIYYADPQNLSGAPAESFQFPVTGEVPDELASLSAEMNGVRIDSVEFLKDDDGNDAVRFYFTYTNTSDEAASFSTNHSYYAMQDGYELEGSWNTESVPEQDHLWEDAEPGTETACAAVFALRSGSPVTLVVYEDWGDGIIAKTAEIG